MEIRADFASVQPLLARLVQFASAFTKNNIETWSHLKNKEDFAQVYRLDWKLRYPLEKIYGDGRDLAGFMSSRLVDFNYPNEFPTLKKFVDSFDNGWLYHTVDLQEISDAAKAAVAVIENPPWAADAMIRLFDEQLSLLQDVKQTIEALKASDIYVFDSGICQNGYASCQRPDYASILECVHRAGRMLEQHPSAYAMKDEESLRDQILVALQALDKVSVSGEAFNKSGKTDILVKIQSSIEFVGECKFWSGKAGYLKTIDQLLGYLTWRDTNTAAIIFVRNVDFSFVLSQVISITSEHPKFLRHVNTRDGSWYSFEFGNSGNSEGLVKIATMFYHLPCV